MTPDEIKVADLDAVKTRAAAVATELAELDKVADFTEEQRASYDALSTEVTALEARKLDIEQRAAVRAKAANIANTEPVGIPTVNVNRAPKNPFDLDELRYGAPVAELRGKAKSAVESVEYLSDAGKQEAIRKLEASARGEIRDPRGVIPGLMLRTGNPTYTSAFAKGLAGAQTLWTDAERKAVAAVEEYRAAMSLTDANGGYAIPFPIDPQIILTNTGAANPIRQLARVETIVTDTWQGISSAGVTASFDAENAEVSDDSPTFAQPQVTTRMARAFVQGSIEISQDFAGLASELTAAFADAKDRLEATVFWSGASASNQPIGIETALNGGASEVAQATGEAMTVADIYNTHQALPPRYRLGGGVAWTAEVSTINFMRQFATANNYHAFLSDLGGGQPAQLLGYPLYEYSAMDAYSDVDAAATAVNHLLLIGQFKNYLVADRVGGTVEFIPHLFATNANLPSFTRGWVYYWRVGADSINDDAFRLYTLTTAA